MEDETGKNVFGPSLSESRGHEIIVATSPEDYPLQVGVVNCTSRLANLQRLSNFSLNL